MTREAQSRKDRCCDSWERTKGFLNKGGAEYFLKCYRNTPKHWPQRRGQIQGAKEDDNCEEMRSASAHATRSLMSAKGMFQGFLASPSSHTAPKFPYDIPLQLHMISRFHDLKSHEWWSRHARSVRLTCLPKWLSPTHLPWDVFDHWRPQQNDKWLWVSAFLVTEASSGEVKSSKQGAFR